MNIITKIATFLLAILAGFAAAFKIGSNHEKFKETDDALQSLRKNKQNQDKWNNVSPYDKLGWMQSQFKSKPKS